MIQAEEIRDLWHRKLSSHSSARLCLALLVLSMVSCGHEPPAGDGSEADAIQNGSPRPGNVVSGFAAESSGRRESSRPPILFGAPDFELTDQTGADFGSAELAGRVWVANFMFTHCAATCPRQSSKLAELQRAARLWPDSDRLRLVSITVDPERDTVERLSEYAQHYQADAAHWKFLTGGRDELVQLSTSGFKLSASAAGDDSSAPLVHSSRFVLVDPQRRVRGYYDSLSDEDCARLLADVRAVLSESAPAGEPIHLGVPNDVFAPPWMESRQAAQLATRDDFTVYHGFEFVDSRESSGIRFTNRAVADAARDFKANHYDHGNGLAVADVDGDGFADVYFVSQVRGNQLWRNLGDGTFEDITWHAGVALEDRLGVSASFADTDNDGDPDLYVTTTRHGNAFFENDGRGCFRNATAEAGLEYTGHSSSADFFDFDRDGLLDLFLTNVGAFTTDEVGDSGDAAHGEFPYYVGKAEAFAGHLFKAWSERSVLYRNEGENRFRDVSETVGLVDAGWSGDATPLDANGDGWSDLYVLNMQGSDKYFENQQGRRFERRDVDSFDGTVWGGMGVKSFDYNNDGLMDLLVTNMHADMWKFQIEANGPEEKQKPPPDVMPSSYFQSQNPGRDILGNALYQGQGGGRFRDVSDEVNAETFWPWGHSVGDVNADGYQDVFIASCMNYPYRYHVNSLLLNDRGERFRDAEFILGIEPRRDGRTAAPWFELDCSGADAGHELCEERSGKIVVWGALGSRSSVIFDLDRDGDLDIVTNDFNTPPMVLVSDLSARNPGLRYVEIELRGTHSNRDGLGAKVQVTAGEDTWTQVLDGQSGYLSQSSLPLYFGLGDAVSIDRVSVQWPNGRVQTIAGPLETNQRLLIVEETVEDTRQPAAPE